LHQQLKNYKNKNSKNIKTRGKKKFGMKSTKLKKNQKLHSTFLDFNSYSLETNFKHTWQQIPTLEKVSNEDISNYAHCQLKIHYFT